MTFYSGKRLEAIRSLSLFDYLKNYEPDNLVRNGSKDYITREHDSLHISNGKWKWWSRKTGGKSALDYLVTVEGMSFPEACKRIEELMHIHPPVKTYYHPENRIPFSLPAADDNNDEVIHYLCDIRKIDPEIIHFFIAKNMIYQDKVFKNAVFVGFNKDKPAYAFKRSIHDNKRYDHLGSNKAYSFSFTNKYSPTLHVFESCIDLLSYMTFVKKRGKLFYEDCYLSLAGASNAIAGKREDDIPVALHSYLHRNKNIKTIIFHLDNDEVGIGATARMINLLNDKYDCLDQHPLRFKDVNEQLVHYENKKTENGGAEND